MKIAIDARAFWWTGVGRYIRNLASELLRQEDGNSYILLSPRGREEEVRQEIGDTEHALAYVGVNPSYYSFSEQTVFFRELERLDVDLVHFTHFNVPLLYRRRYVVTIHDITRFIFPGQKHQSWLKQVAYEQVFSYALRHAKRVIAVSDTTARDIASLPLQLKTSVQMIYEGVDERFLLPISALDRQKARLLAGGNRPFLLFVGVWMSHKNLMRLLDAYMIVKKLHPEIALVITGKPVPGYSDLFQYVKDHELARDVLFPGFVPHALLPALYAEAAAFVFPSLYEGFGLPPLEAMGCGTPVVASNVSSMPELLGDAAVYVNPEHAGDIARGILRVLDDASYRTILVGLGKEQVKRYRWEQAAKDHRRVYQEAR